MGAFVRERVGVGESVSVHECARRVVCVHLNIVSGPHAKCLLAGIPALDSITVFTAAAAAARSPMQALKAVLLRQ